MSLWNTVCSVILCSSVRNRTHQLYEMAHKQLAGEVFLSQNSQIKQNIFAHSFDLTERLRHTDITERYCQ